MSFAILQIMNLQKFVLIASVLFSCFCGASEAPNKSLLENKKIVNDILKKYSSAQFISADLIKEDNKKALGTKTISKGLINYSSEQIYILLNSDKKTEFFYKKNKITFVEYPDADFDKNGSRKVTYLKNDSQYFINSLVNIFSNPNKFFKEFKAESSDANSDLLTLNLKPNIKNLKKFSITVNTSVKEIKNISFIDDVENETIISFSKTDFKTKILPKVFEFKSLKTDQEIRQ